MKKKSVFYYHFQPKQMKVEFYMFWRQHMKKPAYLCNSVIVQALFIAFIFLQAGQAVAKNIGAQQHLKKVVSILPSGASFYQ
ncbi:MAG: hypothetical protein FWG10_06005 [Eubacteriaceae bacterium]|nr:hypothetical protein [Eubacteriaceae bacterium]